MFVVAIGDLATPPETEAIALAHDLGTTPYDARLSLAAGLPAVVLTTADQARALALLAKLRARGHLAVACDGAAVVSSADMVSFRRFALDDGGVTSDGARLPWGDVFCMLPAAHRTTTDTTTSEKERKFNAGLAIATSGVMMTKTVTSEKRAHAVEREHVLYVFRRSGERPWLLRENGTAYTGLAAHAPLAPSRLENFQKLVRLLRAGAPGAIYDERLLALRRVPERTHVAGTTQATTVTTSSDAGMDLLAHVLALTLAKAARSTPYRT